MKYELLVDSREPVGVWTVGLLDVNELREHPKNP